MNDIFDVLETCLRELENGAEVESVLARYPQLAAELRPILMASIAARTRSIPDPSPEVIRRGRAKVLQHAAQMREAKAAPRSKRMIPIFQRLAIALTLAALFLSSGTGLVNASSSALPGENLYPVKTTWENVRLFFTLNEENRETLESSFEKERLREVNELLAEGKDETIRFTGVYMEANGMDYVTGIHIVILDTSILPAEPLSNGMAVLVTGHTNSEGFVDVESIELLPAGSIVPTAEPVEAENDANDYDSDAKKESGNDNSRNEDNSNNHGDGGSDDSGKIANDNGQDDNSGNESNTNDADDNSGNDNGGSDDGNSNDGGDDSGGNSGSGGGGGGDDGGSSGGDG